MKPEEKAEIILWDWLKTPKNNVEEVYFNRKNKLNCPIFSVTGEDISKPDLLIKINDGYKTYYLAIEVKSSNQSKNILKASKIIYLYFKNYQEGKTKYFIDEKEIEISGFLIGSNSSPKGYLFKNEKFIDNRDCPADSSKHLAAAKYKTIPLKEGHRTFEFVRTLWEEYGRIRNNYNKKLSLGILIGDTENKLKASMMLIHHNGKRWSQRWWKL